MKQYEIWRARLPAGERPVLLISRDDAYTYLEKFLVVEITTRVRGIPVEVLLGRHEGLDQRCVANCDNLRTVARSWLLRRMGAVSAARVVEIKRALGFALRWTELINAQ